MKAILLLSLVTSSLGASAQCLEAHLKGKVYFKKSRIYLDIASGSNSAKTFSMSKKTEMSAAAFADQFIAADALLNLEKLELLELRKIERTIPDPLSAQNDFISRKKIPCPK